MIINFMEREMQALSELCERQELSPEAVLRQALRIYQAVVMGHFKLSEISPLRMNSFFHDQEQQQPYPLPENIEALVEAGRLQLAAQKKELLREAFSAGFRRASPSWPDPKPPDFEEWFSEQFAEKQEPQAGQEAEA